MIYDLSFDSNILALLHRKREARRRFLTMKVNLQMYYIPVTRQSSTASPVKVNTLSFPLSGNLSKCTVMNTCALY